MSGARLSRSPSATRWRSSRSDRSIAGRSSLPRMKRVRKGSRFTSCRDDARKGPKVPLELGKLRDDFEPAVASAQLVGAERATADGEDRADAFAGGEMHDGGLGQAHALLAVPAHRLSDGTDVGILERQELHGAAFDH